MGVDEMGLVDASVEPYRSRGRPTYSPEADVHRAPLVAKHRSVALTREQPSDGRALEEVVMEHIPVRGDAGRRAAAPGHGLDPGRHVPDGLGRALSGGGARPPSAVDGFWMDRYPVTNARLRALRAGDRATSRSPSSRAEPRRLSRRHARDARRRSRSCSSSRRGSASTRATYNWWTYVPGADWRHPHGPGSTIDEPAGPSRGARRVRGRGGLRDVGRQGRCRPRPSGSSPRAAVSTAPTYAWGDEFTPEGRYDGEHLARRVPLAATAATTATSGPRPSARSRPTATACTT